MSLKEELHKDFVKTNGFEYCHDLANASLHFNHRAPFAVANFIKDSVKDKHFCHIGCSEGDLELLISRSASKITTIEVNEDRYNASLQKKERGLYHCDVDIIFGDFYERTDLQADVYFHWVGAGRDIHILNHIRRTYSNCIDLACNCAGEPNSREFNIPFDEVWDPSYYSELIDDNAPDPFKEVPAHWRRTMSPSQAIADGWRDYFRVSAIQL